MMILHVLKYPLVILIVLLFFLLLASILVHNVPRFEENACVIAAMDDADLRCGTLFVPESRVNADSPIIELAVVIYPGTGETVAPDPVIYLEGGPGGSALSGWEFWLTSSLRSYSDVILIDQRGTGYSKPTLDCPEINDFELDNPTEACRDRLIAERVNLAAYNSAENAADIAALIESLDLDSANLFGVSYGTRLALTVMRDHPERLRSVIIDAVYPPNVNGLDEQVFYGNRAFEVLFDGCAADAACNAAYPNLRDVFYKTVEILDENPLQLDENESGETVDFTGDDLVNQIFQTLYNTNAIPLLPGTIYAASTGDPDTYSNFGVDYVPESNEAAEEGYGEYGEDEVVVDGDSEGMYNSVECAEDYPFNSLEATEQLSADVPSVLRDLLLISVYQLFDDCELWGVPAQATLENDPVMSDIPTLVLSGEYDPITPPEWGALAAATLTHSFDYTLPGMGHGTVDVRECPTNIALVFLNDPMTEPDSSCIASMPGPTFYTEK